LVLVALNTVQLARRDFLFSDHDQVQSTPEDLCTIRAQNCALFLLTYTIDATRATEYAGLVESVLSTLPEA
jgi:hypothetical protein